MNYEINSLIHKLIDSLQDDIISTSYEITEEIKTREDAFDSIDPLLMILEENPDVDFGSPGPIVHFVERYYKNGYEEKLIDSLLRRPTNHTLWMLNRILNGSGKDLKKEYLNVLDVIIEKFSNDKEIVETANNYRSLHE